MKATVNHEECISCEACVDICPEVFKMNDDDKAVAYTNPVPEDAEDACREAADSCPVDVITIEE